MTTPFIFVFNEKLGTRDEVQSVLDKIPEVTYWYACFPNTIFLTSTVSAFELARRVNALIPGAAQARWVIAAIDAKNSQGRLPPKVWHLMTDPETPRMPKKT
jgi:hypothetical protein